MGETIYLCSELCLILPTSTKSIFLSPFLFIYFMYNNLLWLNGIISSALECIINILDFIYAMRSMFAKWSYLNFIYGWRSPWNMHETDAIGHCNITPPTWYLDAAITTGKVPKLNPQIIIFFSLIVSVAQANKISKSLQIISSPTSLTLDSPYPV